MDSVHNCVEIGCRFYMEPEDCKRLIDEVESELQSELKKVFDDIENNFRKDCRQGAYKLHYFEWDLLKQKYLNKVEENK